MHVCIQNNLVIGDALDNVWPRLYHDYPVISLYLNKQSVTLQRNLFTAYNYSL